MRQNSPAPWREEDAPHLIATAQCPHVQQWLRDWTDVAQWALPWIEGQAWRHEMANPEQAFMSWAITAPPSDVPIGVMNLGGDETDHHGVSLGYFLHEDALHKGYATQAVQALAQHVFARWQYPEISASARVENLPSRQVLVHAGFQYLETRKMELPGYDDEVDCAFYVLKR